MKELGTIQYCGQASRVAIKELCIVRYEEEEEVNSYM